MSYVAPDGWPTLWNDGRASGPPRDALALLCRVLDGVPRFGAGRRCADNPDLWDTEDPRKSQVAAAQCQQCPALAPCSRWAAAQPPRTLSGVIAGKLYAHPFTTTQPRRAAAT